MSHPSDLEDALPAGLQRLASAIDSGALSPAGVRRRVEERARRRRTRRAAASGGFVAVVAILVGTLGVLDDDDGRRSVLTGPASPATTTATVGAVPAAAPTLVAPTVLPPGLQFIEGGTLVPDASAVRTITLAASGTTRPVRLTWWPVMRGGGCQPGSAPSASRSEAIRSYLDGTVNQLGWCEPEGALVVVLHGPDVPRQRLADLALTVSRDPTDGAKFTLVPPAGFRITEHEGAVPRSVLLYGRPGAATPWPALRIQVETAYPNALERSGAEWGVTPVTIGGRRALIGPVGILVLYDEHTLVTVSGTALSEDNLRRAAESLAPADRSMVPDVAYDGPGGRCVRLGLCR